MHKPNVLLTISGIVYFAVGLPLLFAPDDLLRAAGVPASVLDTTLLQLLGCALFGFAMLNWMNRHAVIGGIFGRPLVAANLAHAGSAAGLLLRMVVRHPAVVPLDVAAAAYTLIAIGFGIRLFAAPATGGMPLVPPQHETSH